MGLGPHGVSLKHRLGKPSGLPFSDPFVMMIEQHDRMEARRLRAQELAAKHRTQPKPVAPVTPQPKVKGEERQWLWTGENIPSKGLELGGMYLAAVIRKAGFKLPSIGEKKK